jgi:hypothetical protein
VKTKDFSLLILLALCLSWGGFNLGRSLFGPKFGLDFTQYYVASRMALDGDVGNIYRDDGYYRAKAEACGAVTEAGGTMTNAYPPFAAFAMIPFALLPYRPALLLFSAVGLLALGAGVWAFFADETDPRRRELTLAGLLLAFAFFPVYYSLYMGQINALLFLFAALAFCFARRERPWLAGFCIALATLIKIYPAVLLLFFAAKRQYRIVIATLVCLIGLVAVSLPVCSARLYGTYLSEVLPRQTDGGAFYRNQGLGGLFARLLTTNECVPPVTNRPAAAHWLTILGGAAVLVSALAVAAHKGPRSPGGDLEFATCLVAALLALPKSWEHYGVMLLFAYLALYRRALDAPGLPRVPLLLTLISFCVWTFLLPLGTDYEQLPKSLLMQPLFSAKCAATALLFAACLWILLRPAARVQETS